MRVLSITREDLPEDFIILIPIGSVEQHGPHLPLGTDSIIAEYVANEVERRFPDKVLLFPVIAIGSSMEHVGFQGVTYVRFESLYHYLLDLLESVSSWGAVGVVFVNGHGGNVDVLNLVVKSWNYGHDRPRALHYYIYNQRVTNLIRRFFPSFGHADAAESSIIAAISKDLVRWDRVLDVEANGNINVTRTIEVSATGIVGTLRRDLIRPEVGAELLRFIIDDLIGQLRTYYPGLLS
ncbi:MAG: creatininase family protein [Vulcanisaeta sp.]|jgi:creatinine amidohydrolase|nr:creatininase family protein [Vulcanisaeta sp.]MCG2892371.1 creatininase family protein [Vulcanisaeta sp.]MCG2894876.1 creatininase family protein [Vulcanisaeta sp.]